MPTILSTLLNHAETPHTDLESTFTGLFEDEDLEAAEMDREEETAGLVDELEVDDIAAKKAFRQLPDEMNTIDLSDMTEALKKASEDIIVGKTAKEYNA